MKVPININNDNCRGCRRYEMACSWQADGMINPRNAGIKIHIESFCGKEPEEKKGQGIPVCVFACAFETVTMDDVKNLG